MKVSDLVCALDKYVLSKSLKLPVGKMSFSASTDGVDYDVAILENDGSISEIKEVVFDNNTNKLLIVKK